ncbi:Mur ligase family protein [Salipaludibacillus sp. HK11]|uniref:Mur ligase family protein n=1 Tax=Salipaludibacillus sp. HK11 TaxID=3394320 RepID=UPI0039FB9B24
MFILTILYIMLLAAWILPITLKVKQSVHMLQLNSFRNEHYDRWMNTNRNKVFHMVELSFLLPLIVVVFTSTQALIFVAAIIVFVVTFIVFWKTKSTEYKKLVYSQRVQRLLATTHILYGVIACAAIVLMIFVPFVIVIILLISSEVLAFYVVRLANTINEPIEARINQGIVNDAKRLMQASPDLKIIGITESFSKTSVKHVVHAILSANYNVLVTPESYHTKLGVARIINEQLKTNHDIFIAEMGAEQEGYIKEICDLLHQQVGVITPIEEQHLKTFTTVEEIKKIKHEIVETLSEKEGVAILNKDDDNMISYKGNNSCRKVYYGIDAEDLDLCASNIKYTASEMSFTVTLASGEVEIFRTKLLGEQNVYNTLAGIAVGLEMGLSLKQMVPSVKEMNPLTHRLE